MSFYVYKAIDKKGKNQGGSAVALDQAEVLRDIKARDLFPVEVKEVTEDEFYKQRPGQDTQKKKSFKALFAKRMKTKDLVMMLRDLSSLIGAGVVITRAIDILSDQVPKNSPMKTVVVSIHDIVTQGEPFSAALRKFPRYFPPLVAEMVAVGEQSGRLEEILDRLALFYERQEQLEASVKQAMTYPIVIFSVALIAVFVFMTVALPRMVKIFSELDTELPAITLFLINSSAFMQKNWAFIILVFVGAGMAFNFALGNREFRRRVQAFIMKVPVVGELYYKVIISRLLRAMGAMYKSGISILVLFQMLPQVIQNVLFEDAIERIASRVRRGEGLSNSFLQETLFPRAVANIIYVGEESGTLDVNLDRIAGRYEEEVDRMTKVLGTLIEPFFIVFMGGFVLFIALALFMPLVKLVTTLST